MSVMQIHDGGVASKERSQKFGEVFTPQWMVEKMLDLLEEENTGCFMPDTVYLDPACGEGQFPLGVLRRKFSNCEKKADYETAALSVWGLDIQPDNVEICIENVLTLCKERFRVSKKLEEEIRKRYILGDSLKVLHLLHLYEGGMVLYVLPGGHGNNDATV